MSSSQASSRIPWWLWLNVLSLDAPVVAVLWQWALAQAYGVRMNPVNYSTLGLAVWLIYLLDRVLDTRSCSENQSFTARHVFYRRHRSFCVWVVIPAATAFLMYRGFTSIPAPVMWRGFGLSFLVGLYLLHFAAHGHRTLFILGSIFASFLGGVILWFLPLSVPYKVVYGLMLLSLLHHSIRGSKNNPIRLLPKELLCGYLFAIGCSMTVNFYTSDAEADAFSMVTFMLGMLCTLNCIGIACYEKESDRDPQAITQVLPRIGQFYPALLLALAGLALFEISRNFSGGLLYYHIAIMFGAALLGGVFFLSERISSELAHVLSDVALMLPVLVMLLA